MCPKRCEITWTASTISDLESVGFGRFKQSCFKTQLESKAQSHHTICIESKCFMPLFLCRFLLVLVAVTAVQDITAGAGPTQAKSAKPQSRTSTKCPWLCNNATLNVPYPYKNASSTTLKQRFCRWFGQFRTDDPFYIHPSDMQYFSRAAEAGIGAGGKSLLKIADMNRTFTARIWTSCLTAGDCSTSFRAKCAPTVTLARWSLFLVTPDCRSAQMHRTHRLSLRPMIMYLEQLTPTRHTLLRTDMTSISI